MPTNTLVAARYAAALQTTDDRTRVAPDHFYPTFVSEDVQLNQAHIPSAGLGLNYLSESGFAVGNRNPGGSHTMELVPEQTGLLMQQCLGTVVTTGTGPDYQHTFTQGSPLPSLTEQTVLVDSRDGTERPKDAVGSKVATWAINFDATGDGSMVQLERQLLSFDLLTDQTPVAAVWPGTITRWTSVQATVSLAAGELCVDNGTFGVDNALTGTGKACQTYQGRPQVHEDGFRTVTATVLTNFTDWTNHDRIAAGTEAELKFTFETNATTRLTATLNVRTTGDTAVVPGPNLPKQTLNFTGTGPNAISVVLDNQDATP